MQKIRYYVDGFSKYDDSGKKEESERNDQGPRSCRHEKHAGCMTDYDTLADYDTLNPVSEKKSMVEVY